MTTTLMMLFVLFLFPCLLAFWLLLLLPSRGWSLLCCSKGCPVACHKRRAKTKNILKKTDIKDHGSIILRPRSSRKTTFLSRRSKPWCGPSEPKSTIYDSKRTNRWRTPIVPTCSDTSCLFVNKIKTILTKPIKPP